MECWLCLCRRNRSFATHPKFPHSLLFPPDPLHLWENVAGSGPKHWIKDDVAIKVFVGKPTLWYSNFEKRPRVPSWKAGGGFSRFRIAMICCKCPMKSMNIASLWPGDTHWNGHWKRWGFLWNKCGYDKSLRLMIDHDWKSDINDIIVISSWYHQFPEKLWGKTSKDWLSWFRHWNPPLKSASHRAVTCALRGQNGRLGILSNVDSEVICLKKCQILNDFNKFINLFIYN